MTHLKLWNCFIILSLCIVLLFYRLVVVHENDGPLIAHSLNNLPFEDLRFLENSGEPRQENRTTFGVRNKGDEDESGRRKSSVINISKISKAWSLYSAHQSFRAGAVEGDDIDDDGRKDESHGDVDELSIADIWQPFDDEDDETWKVYEDDYAKIEWKENKKGFQKWRSDLEMYGVDSQKNFLVTWDSVEVNRVLPFYMSTQHTYSVSKFFMSLIPKASPYSGKGVGRCAVVGNSGILRNSRCGREIDAADYVFRCNIPPLVDYKDDVGLKTNLTTMNPSMLDSGDFGTLFLTRQPDDPYYIVLESYNGVILLPCFSHFFYLRRCIKAIKQYRYYENNNANMTFLHPEHFSTIWEYWKDHHMTNLLSTGFYIVNVAATLCEKVDLYGFWPFDKTSLMYGKSEHVMYHYYEEGKWRPAHDMIGEFGQLFQLHKEGVLRMHLGKCEAR